MRILIILENYYPRIGGVETFFKSLGEKLDEQGYHVTVLTNRYDKRLKSKESVGQNISIIRKRYYNRYLFTFGAWVAALKHARKAELIHTTSYNAAIPAWIAAKLTGTKSIITFHEYWGNLWYRLPWMPYPVKVLHKLFEAWITKLGFNKFVAVSNFTKESLISSGINSSKVVSIYNGLAYDGFPNHTDRKTKNEVFTYLYYGRVGYAKGLDILIEAYKLLSDKVSHHRLVLVLPSEQTALFQKIEEAIDRLELNSLIEIKHDLTYEALTNQIALADAVVIPSYSEGFCFAAAETMAIGTPIISSGQGALAEVVCGQHLTMDAHNPTSLADAMNAALNGQWDYSEVRKFKLEDTIQAYLRLYQELID